MSASWLNMIPLKKFGVLCSYSRLTCIRFHQKRCIQEDVCMPPAEYDRDDMGNLTGPVAKPFPRGLDVDPGTSALYAEEPLRYPKQHPGLVILKKAPVLPERLLKTARLLLAEHDLINNNRFEAAVKHLLEVFMRRQPPVEEKLMEERKQQIVHELLTEEIERENIDVETLSEEQQKRLQQKISTVAKKVFMKTSHNWKPIEYRGQMGLTYLAARLAPNYTVLHQIFHEIHKLDRDFSPGAVLNMGSGVGTTVWAANTIWADNVYEYYNVDSSNYMNDVARKLLAKDKSLVNLAVRGVNFRQFLPSPKHIQNRFPMVVSAYLLMEQPNIHERLDLVRLLWELTDQYLVLVEHGTTAGYRLIMEARELILQIRTDDPDLDGHVFAPCTHDAMCPKLQLKNSPCTFSIEYRKLHIKTDFGQGDIKATEKYSYVVFKKGPRQEGDNFPRVTNVLKKPTHIHCQMCCPDGSLRQFVVTKSRPSVELFRCTKRCRPGDFIPFHWPKLDTSSQEMGKDAANLKNDCLEENNKIK